MTQPDEAAPQAVPLDPVVASKIAMPPALVEAIQDDPELLAKLSRGQLAVLQDRMVKRVLSDPDASVSQYATVHERLTKVAAGSDRPTASPVGATVVINFIRNNGRNSITVEGEAQAEPVLPDAA